jgi:phosphoglycerol transferase
MSFNHYKKYKNTFLSDKAFVHAIEEEITSNKEKKILQLPYIPYPEQPITNKLGGYDQSVGYLHSSQIKWSYGAVRGRESDKWLKRLIKKPLKEQIKILKTSGFNGIYIDRRGYKDSAKSLENDLSKILNVDPIVSKDGTKSFFKIKPTGNKIYNLNYPLEFTAGFYGWDNGFGSWGWAGGNCRLQYENNISIKKPLDISFKIGTIKKRNVSIFYEDQKIQSINLEPGESKIVRLSIVTKPGRNVLTFITDTKAHLAGKGDGRRVTFNISDMTLKIRK